MHISLYVCFLNFLGNTAEAVALTLNWQKGLASGLASVDSVLNTIFTVTNNN